MSDRTIRIFIWIIRLLNSEIDSQKMLKKWSKMVKKNGKKWSKNVKNCEKCEKMAKWSARVLSPLRGSQGLSAVGT